MKNKIKLSLEELKVESFLTSKEMLEIHGGITENACYPPCATHPYPCQSGIGDPPHTQICHTSAATCNYTNYGTCTCAPSTADYTACYC